MVLFCDTSVLLAASGSPSGASRYIFDQARFQDCQLVSSPWCVGEAKENVRKLPGKPMDVWKNEIKPVLMIVPEALTFHWLLVFPKTKGRPVLLAALAAEADRLLTLDKVNF